MLSALSLMHEPLGSFPFLIKKRTRCSRKTVQAVCCNRGGSSPAWWWYFFVWKSLWILTFAGVLQVLRFMKDVWLFGILDPTQRLKTASAQWKVYAARHWECSAHLEGGQFFHPSPFLPTQQIHRKVELCCISNDSLQIHLPLYFLCWQIWFQSAFKIWPCGFYFANMYFFLSCLCAHVLHNLLTQCMSMSGERRRVRST